jgi:hypothetical protein
MKFPIAIGQLTINLELIASTDDNTAGESLESLQQQLGVQTQKSSQDSSQDSSSSSSLYSMNLVNFTGRLVLELLLLKEDVLKEDEEHLAAPAPIFDVQDQEGARQAVEIAEQEAQLTISALTGREFFRPPPIPTAIQVEKRRKKRQLPKEEEKEP